MFLMECCDTEPRLASVGLGIDRKKGPYRYDRRLAIQGLWGWAESDQTRPDGLEGIPGRLDSQGPMRRYAELPS